MTRSCHNTIIFLQAEQDRLQEIQYENGLLLEKMQAIMRQDVGGPAVEFAPGVRITRNQIPVTDTFVSAKTCMPGNALPVVSLGASARKREQARIMAENKVGRLWCLRHCFPANVIVLWLFLDI